MSFAVAIQMDHVSGINIDADSTFMLAMEAQNRGHRLFHYVPRDLYLKHGRVFATMQPLQVRREKGTHFTLGAEQDIELTAMDVVLMRQDPPFDMAYITATHLLEHVHPKTLVVNDPVSVRNAPEKLFVTHFADLMPPTLITSDLRQVKRFRQEHKDIIVKPLFGNGGAGVFHLPPGDENLSALLEIFTQLYREPVIVQRYVPEVRQGDKRIILVEGEAVGAINREPAAGEVRANMHVGGKPVKTELSPRERHICKSIGPARRERGLVFVGIDVIGDYLTEINVTSPTGIQEINRFNGVQIESLTWDAIEKRRG